MGNFHHKGLKLKNEYMINYTFTCLKFSNYYPSNLCIVNFTNNGERDFQYYTKNDKITIWSLRSNT